MRWFWIFVVGLALVTVEIGVVVHLRRFWSGPDLVLLFVVFVSLYGPYEDAPIAGWLLGLAKDSLSTGPFGLYAVLFLCLSFLLSRIRTDIFTESNKAHVANAGVSTLLVYFGASIWRATQGGALVSMLSASVGVAVWNGVLAPFAFKGFFRMSRLLGTARRPT